MYCVCVCIVESLIRKLKLKLKLTLSVDLLSRHIFCMHACVFMFSQMKKKDNEENITTTCKREKRKGIEIMHLARAATTTTTKYVY